MDSRVNELLLKLGWKLPYIRFLSSRRTVILLYHGVPRENDGTSISGPVFEQHIVFLKQHFKIVAPNELWDRREPYENVRVMLTFDDGFRNNAEVVAPILRKYDAPAMFFVCSRHSVPGKYLWFAYLQALEQHFPDKGFYFRGDFFDMSSDQRHSSIRQLWQFLINLKPHPSAMYEAIEGELPRLEDFISGQKLTDCYAGMTVEQVNELSRDPLFSIGVHTVDHPFLSKCQLEEARRQILENKKWIEQTSSKPCNSIAYPTGDYNAEVLEQCRDLGLKHGHALIPLLNTDVEYELPRMGIYSASLDLVGFKVQWGNVLQAIGVKVG